MSPSNAVKRMEPAARTNVNGGRFTPRSKHPSPESIMDRSDNPRLNIKPIAYAIGMLLLSGAAQAAGPRPFSGDWFAVKGATRAATAEAARSGGLPGMTPPWPSSSRPTRSWPAPSPTSARPPPPSPRRRPSRPRPARRR
ncbi:hypothetical protein GTU79_26835 [Sodalis ligni]|uniref:hypothetical protein n=1 Tax=Sodalis ligni TaxID=2697027 RepID=UPI001BDEE655|nr:hypothetical protein [Sodalis ligni]QWA10742.1 hypothetical protein GTU79_26835 [Sodalis ligni]